MPEHLEDWRRGRVSYLEKIMRANLNQINFAMKCFRSAFRFLVAQGANKKIGGLSLLGVAVLEGNVDIAKILDDEFGYDVNRYERAGIPVLSLAVLSGENGMITFLVERGADLNAKLRNSVQLKKPSTGTLLIGKTYFSFPVNSTPLTFAKAYERLSSINTILELGGTEPAKIEVKESFSF